MDKEFVFEKNHLKEVLIKYDEILEEENLRLDSIPRMYKDNERLVDALLYQTEHKIYIMENAKEKPYFARIDFKEKDTDDIYKCYIGKVGVLDEDNNLITVDWRAPIASMYYDSNIGSASYISPLGKIKGELLVKRQFEIENKKLLSFQDVDTVSNDDILKPYLGVTADNRLKNIVSSIQKEQNEIIRKDIEEDLIVSGVAGSGKTTVALHRVAYLVYNNKETVDTSQYMVIGPNKFFLNYISSVLPDLDVMGASQVTFLELTKKMLNEKFTVTSDEEKIKEIIKMGRKSTLNRIKTSLSYKTALNKFMKDFENNFLNEEDFYIKSYKIVPLKVIKDIYKEIDRKMYLSIESITERMKIRIKKYINDNYDEIIFGINEQMHKKFQNSKSKEEETMVIKEADYVKRELSKNNINSLKKYFSKSNIKIFTLYSDFINNLDKYIDLDLDMEKERDITLKKLKKKIVDFEDLSAILYLKYKISENRDYRNFKYVVIDEAQDFGEFNFYVLKKIMPNAKFSIFGDLAQSIYDYRSISNWNSVSSIFKDSEMMYLLKSYRTTTEIMNEANKILKYINLPCAKPVIRHGKAVEYIKEDDLVSQIQNKIEEYKSKGYKSIAVISKTVEETFKISELLSIYNVSSAFEDYVGGICSITSYLAKGLEFDAVIINDASSVNYLESSEVDMKLLYVSMTRALHELCVIYKGNITKALA